MYTPSQILSLLMAPMATVLSSIYKQLFKPVYNLMNLKERICLMLGLFSAFNTFTRPWKIVWLLLSIIFLRKSLLRHWNTETYQAHVKPPLKKGVLVVLEKLL
jgi:hypothetical protein